MQFQSCVPILPSPTAAYTAQPENTARVGPGQTPASPTEPQQWARWQGGSVGCHHPGTLGGGDAAQQMAGTVA